MQQMERLLLQEATTAAVAADDATKADAAAEGAAADAAREATQATIAASSAAMSARLAEKAATRSAEAASLAIRMAEAAQRSSEAAQTALKKRRGESGLSFPVDEVNVAKRMLQMQMRLDDESCKET